MVASPVSITPLDTDMVPRSREQAFPEAKSESEEETGENDRDLSEYPFVSEITPLVGPRVCRVMALGNRCVSGLALGARIAILRC